MIKILIILTILSVITGIIFCYRNNKVYKTRIWFIDNQWDLYKKLPSYNKILYSFRPTSIKYWLKKLNNSN